MFAENKQLANKPALKAESPVESPVVIQDHIGINTGVIVKRMPICAELSVWAKIPGDVWCLFNCSINFHITLLIGERIKEWKKAVRLLASSRALGIDVIFSKKLIPYHCLPGTDRSFSTVQNSIQNAFYTFLASRPYWACIWINIGFMAIHHKVVHTASL